MQIDITKFVKENDMFTFSASQAELGRSAGRITWRAALEAATDYPFIDLESREEFEEWIREFGAWELEEINGWSLEECSALLIQFIAGEVRSLQEHYHNRVDLYCKGEGGRLYRHNRKLYFDLSY